MFNQLLKTIKQQGYINFNGSVLLRYDGTSKTLSVLSQYEQGNIKIKQIFKPVYIDKDVVNYILNSDTIYRVANKFEPTICSVYFNYEELKELANKQVA